MCIASIGPAAAALWGPLGTHGAVAQGCTPLSSAVQRHSSRGALGLFKAQFGC